ncbi:MAG: endopeptidase La [Verrucomicrobiales bacterium]|jgi:ATP-dependent Lon protease|nr:endopeptidase La [Verrucomicrobiales bacterium]|tara:strand:- start:29018 stop:31426 length:2409 start_codon:yes stop_codon:yes gene_type:complete
MEDFEQMLNESSGEIIEISTSLPDTEMPEWRSDLPNVLPVMPLRGVVLFPGTVAPLTVERTPSQQLLEELLPTGRLLGLVTQKDTGVDDPAPSDVYRVGALGNVLRMVRQDDGQTLVLVQIVERIKLTKFLSKKPYLKARFKILENVFPKQNDMWEATLRNLRESAEKFIETNPAIPDEATDALSSIESPSILTDFLATNLSLELKQKQSLLEETSVAARAEEVQQILNNQLHIAELQNKLRANVEDEFSDAQRRAYLREQLRAIQRELGQGDGTEEQSEELRDRLETAQLPEDVMEAANRELKRLDVIPPASPEHSVIVSYLETVAELPWNNLCKDNRNLKRAREILDRDHFSLEKVKQRLLEYLAVRKLNPDGRGPILCLLGPPGVGKTSLGHSIAEALGREFARISVGGIRDEAEIRGHRRTYVGSMPGRLIQELRRVGTRNPVIMLDEVDKIGADFRGDPASALLEVLDPRQNHGFVDRYLDVPFDLSQVIFIATANTIYPVPAPLRDRMEIISIPGYTGEEKLEIATRHLVKRQLKENGLTRKRCTWSRSALRHIIEEYTREAGVRNLEREIGSVCRSVAAKVAVRKSTVVKVTPEYVEKVLGPPKFSRETMMRKSRPGVVNGLAYTPFGGEVLNIEALRYPGKGSIKLTGQIGEVMKESMHAAWSLVQHNACELGINTEDFDKYDVHVHVPAGAVPKDGPSAGCAMYTALASLFANRRVNKDIAMTGEINLRGSVLPIGGLKEKALGALQAGIKTILVPAENIKDVPDIPESARKKLKILPISKLEDILEAVLLKR